MQYKYFFSVRGGTYINVQIIKVGRPMPPSLHFFVRFIGMSERLKPSIAAFRRVKANREENLTKYAWSTHAFVKMQKK